MLGSVIGWLNGRKTIIGGCLTIAAEVLGHVAPLAAGTPVARYAGLGLLGIGLIHKGWKKIADWSDLDPLDGGGANLIPLLAFSLVGLMAMAACGGLDLLKPDPEASPSPSSTVSPSPDPSADCVPASGVVIASLDVAGKRDIPIFSWAGGQRVILRAVLVNAGGKQLEPSCGAPIVTLWRIFGPAFCSVYGNIDSPEIRMECLSGGDVEVEAHRANTVATAVFRVTSSASEGRRWILGARE